MAQLLCRELVAGGANVTLHVPERGRSQQQQAQLTAELLALPWMQGAVVDPSAPAELRLFAGTPEQFWEYQASQHHRRANAPLLLLTSWWDSLAALQPQLQGPVLPVYPRVTVESWQGRLAVLGSLQLELPNDGSQAEVNLTAVGELLDTFDLAWQARPMQHRFKALFARTSFAYWYLAACLEPAEQGSPAADRSIIEAHWHRIQPLLDNEPDLRLPLPMLELAMAVMRQGDPESSDPAWILEVLLHHKRAKLNYFLQRQQWLFRC